MRTLFLEMKILPSRDKINSSEIDSESLLCKNGLDIRRVIDAPRIEIDSDTFLIPPISMGVMIDDDDDGDDNGSVKLSDDDTTDEETDTLPVKRQKILKHGSGVFNEKNKHASSNAVTKKEKKRSLSQQILHLSSHKRIYRKAWMAFLSLSAISLAQHKIILKHLAEYVIPYLDKPIFLADYLTQCYNIGGIIAVLALESLFQLIVNHNLDYPNFFVSLYKLCNVEVFEAKYRTKFMKLLSQCLKSTNIPVYTIASFIKRLAYLSLHTPSPCAIYCLAQITWLLKEHQQCLVLLHRQAEFRKTFEEIVSNQFKIDEEVNLEKSDAMKSSLFELHALRNHFIYEVNSLARALEDSSSTTTGEGSTLLVVSDFIDQSYAQIMDAELNRVKSASAVPLAYRQPSSLFAAHAIKDKSTDDMRNVSVISNCFGSSFPYFRISTIVVSFTVSNKIV
jgi:hypothetical protein